MNTVSAKPEYEEAGEFWLASRPNYKRVGILTVIEGQGIQLEINGLLRPLALETRSEDLLKLGRIHGKLQNGRQVTLDDCGYQRIKVDESEKSLVNVNRVFIGAQYKEEAEIKINTFCFSMGGLSKWLSIKGIDCSWGDPVSFTAIPQDKIRCELEDGLEVNIVIHHILSPCNIPVVKVEMIQKEYIVISSKMLRPYSEFFELCLRINSLFNIIIDPVVHVRDITVNLKEITYNEGTKKGEPVSISVYDSHFLFSGRKAEVKRRHVLFNFHEIKKYFEQFINAWLSFYEGNKIIFDLYHAAKREGLFIEFQFLSLFQALEVYSKKELIPGSGKQNKEITLTLFFNRIVEYFLKLEPADIPKLFSKNFHDSNIRERFVKRIVYIRNIYTHRMEHPKMSKDEVPPTIEESIVLRDVMKMFVQVIFLQSIGFEDAKIKDMLGNARTPLGRRYYDTLCYINNEMSDIKQNTNSD